MDPLDTLTETLTPRTGTVRLRLTPTGRVLLVGPFASLGGARQLARRLRPQAGKTSGNRCRPDGGAGYVQLLGDGS
jgi:hypothetical protein